MKSIISKDLYRYGGLKGIKGFLEGLLIPGFVYTYFLRKSAGTRRRSPLGMFYRFLLRRYSFKYGIQIPAGTNIGEGFYIGHFGNIIINHRAVIGKNCNISQGVTVGMISKGASKGVPVIGDSVWLGANSVIVGNIRIGNDVVIAPGSFVNFDVPDNSVVIGEKCRIIPKSTPTEGQINFRV